MNEDLYSTDIQSRFKATPDSTDFLEKKWPRGCKGAANAYLVLLGPSMGGPPRGESGELGAESGLPRPSIEPMTIGKSVMEFNGLGPRKNRWNKLCAELLGGENYITALTALLNLDWSHSPSEGAIGHEHLVRGFKEVWPLFTQIRPRIICTLTRRVWDTVVPEMSHLRRDFPICPISLPITPKFVRLPGCDFVTMLIKPQNHPSRFLSYQQISILGEISSWFQSQPPSIE